MIQIVIGENGDWTVKNLAYPFSEFIEDEGNQKRITSFIEFLRRSKYTLESINIKHEKDKKTGNRVPVNKAVLPKVGKGKATKGEQGTV